MDSTDELGPGWKNQKQTMMNEGYVKEVLERPDAEQKYPCLLKRYKKRTIESKAHMIYGRWRKESTKLLGQSREDLGLVPHPCRGPAGELIDNYRQCSLLLLLSHGDVCFFGTTKLCYWLRI